MSHELADAIGVRSGRAPQVVSGRIDFDSRISSETRGSLRRRFGLDDSESVALMVSRACSTKIRSLRAFIELVSRLAEDDTARRWRGIICGNGDNSIIDAELNHLCERANQRLGRRVVFRDTSYSQYAYRLLPIADVFIGVGDAFAEAAAHRIPALVLGESGFAGLLSPDTEVELYRYNLSGRNSLTAEPIRQTAHRLMELMGNHARCSALVEFAQASVARHFGARGAVDKYESLYRELPVVRNRPDAALIYLQAVQLLRKLYLTYAPAQVRAAVLKLRGLT